ncbi:MAG: hypothetical protein WA395_14450 [Nitrososphaeraceae archaeon]
MNPIPKDIPLPQCSVTDPILDRKLRLPFYAFYYLGLNVLGLRGETAKVEINLIVYKITWVPAITSSRIRLKR